MPKTLTDDQVLELFRSRWVTSSEAAVLLGLSGANAVRKIVSQGRLDAKRVGGTLVLRRADLEAYRRIERRGRKPSGKILT